MAEDSGPEEEEKDRRQPESRLVSWSNALVAFFSVVGFKFLVFIVVVVGLYVAMKAAGL